MSQKLITVFGATGNQGGSVARALARNGFQVRGVCRKTDSAAANDLKAAGIEVVQADFDNKKSLLDALQGAYGCFIVTVTNFDDPNCLNNEIKQGKNVVDACSEANIQHVVFSTLFSPRKITGIEGRHADANKAVIEQYIKEKEMPLSCICVPFSYENLFTICKPELIGDDMWRIGIPMGESSIDGMCVNDIGIIVNEIFKDPKKYMNKTMGPSGDKRSISEMMAILSRQLSPRKFIDRQITMMEFREFSWNGARDWANYFDMMVRVDQQKKAYGMRIIHPDMLTFEQWVAANRSEFEKIL